MKKYKYTDSTEVRFSIGENEYFLQQGNTYELPSQDSYIRLLEAQGHLTPCEPEKPSKQTKRV